MADQKQIRVMLWCVPRAGSTAFLRCIAGRDDVKAFRELFVACRFFGPNATSGFAKELNAPVENEFTYEKVKEKLEADYDFPVIFAKDGAKSIYGHYNCIPKGFQHTFLIKKPSKIHMSKKRLFDNYKVSIASDKNATYDQTTDDHSGSPLYEMLELVKYVRDVLKQEIIIIDGDDLLANPEAMMKKWCESVGIPFRPEMMTWKKNCNVNWEMSEGHKMMMDIFPKASYNALNSVGFSSHVAAEEVDKTDIPEDVLKCIEASEPYYKELYAMRMTVE
ncbi:uncharacterized protein LOC117122008 [Anneissia japonica]|uniref:uncharacterized protein LOC117122008 n=1 Tax=Anneissia japonica TaxID=1529436 RepID=UPI0014259A6A|nr:uncharacterized protein LOC117122008 [Anneissia japonica]XP_033123370.1 uncharacterized protein LOC117122008 [Anneissia japonica]XP_033123371.1 uncharacterized protein LOC117122008 [Anneissia japonica]XP_033123372.1 uncharacterized protein LOC117122008 [Anneissia japonica]